ncbi:MAG: type II secretion system F family protein [Alphaproteobacteria bacterium]|nr:type II secretion system F family protein [Alphaproteobacteria bacterium]
MRMERYKYKAINERGRIVRGAISAAGEANLYQQLQTAGLELVDCRLLTSRKGLSLGGLSLKRIKIRDLIQFFVHMEQMQNAGVPLLDALADVRDTTENNRLRDIMSEIHRDVSDGASLSEAMKKHSKIFNNLHTSLIKAGEETGDLTAIYVQLVKYMKWVDEMQSKVRKATRYPLIVTMVVIVTIVVMMGFVVPQIVGFLKNLDQDLSIFTTSLMATSEFFQKYWMWVLGTPVALVVILKILKRLSDNVAYKLDSWLLMMPVVGPLIRKISIARYAQTFGALFSSGIDVISALKAARLTVSNRALLEALESVERYVQSGSPLSDAFNTSGEFPSMVVRMLRIGEGSGNLSQVLDQVAEFYTRDVDEAIQGLITMIEPALTGILGGMILWIAAAVFGPIYSMLDTIEF